MVGWGLDNPGLDCNLYMLQNCSMALHLSEVILLLVCGQFSLQSVVHSNWHYETHSSVCKCAVHLEICAEFSSKNIMFSVILWGKF
jgi:hypothetical protein